MKTKLYTAGYKNFSFYELKTLVVDNSLMLVDIRFVPYTPLPFWSKAELEKVFGDSYIHVKALGNVNYNKSDPGFELSDYPSGLEVIRQLLEQGKKCILLCGCYDYDACHRKLVAEKLTDDLEGIEVCEIDLDDDKILKMLRS